MTIERAIKSRQEEIERYQAVKKKLKKEQKKERAALNASIESLRKQIKALQITVN
jgi:hypothetical protein